MQIAKFRIQLTILISSLMVLIIACSAIIYYNYTKTTQAFLDVVEEDIQQATQSIVRATTSYMMPAKTLAHFLARSVQHHNSVLDDPARLIEQSMEMLDLYPQISAFFNGDHMGNLVAVSRIGPDFKPPVDPNRRLPSTIQYQVRIINRTAPSVVELFEYRDKSGKVVAVLERPKDVEYYDPRKRPWYLGTLQTKEPYWSDPYIFSITQEIGITATFPLKDSFNHVLIVTSADITMAEISNVLARNKIGRHGLSFIFNEQGQILGYPDVNKMIKAAGKDMALATIDDTNNPLVTQAYHIFKEKQQKAFEMKANGEEYIVRFIHFGQEFQKDWWIAFVAPKSDFTAQADQMRLTMVIFSLLILLFSALLIYVIAKHIAKPIENVARELQAIEHFNIESSKPIQSVFFEIEMMNQALSAMKRSLKDFSRFVPKAVVRKLIESGEGAELGGRKMYISILFTDVKGFSTISEKLTSEKIALHISEYFDELTQIIIEEGGTVDKYIGDSIMAFWGAPVESNDHPIHACRATVRCIKKLEELNKTWLLDGKPPLPTRFGIHTGDAIVGNVGSKDRLNYSAFGDSVNTASRLEGTNKFYQTTAIVSHDTYKQVRNDFICRPLDIVAVYGKTQGVKIYELMDMRNGSGSETVEHEELERIAQLTTEAFGLYLEREFEAALKVYETLRKIAPEDHIADLYIQRCKEYIKSPPPDDWRGIYVMTTK